MSSRTDFLFVEPSFLRGFIRIVDIFGLLDESSYNFSDSPKEADYRALRSDWYAVGDDLISAAAHVEEEELEHLRYSRL